MAFSEAEVRYEGSRFFVLTTAQDGFNLTWLPSLYLGLSDMAAGSAVSVQKSSKFQTFDFDVIFTDAITSFECF